MFSLAEMKVTAMVKHYDPLLKGTATLILLSSPPEVKSGCVEWKSTPRTGPENIKTEKVEKGQLSRSTVNRCSKSEKS